MLTRLRILWSMLKRAFADWNSNNGWLYGSALAYYSVFAIAPLLIIVVGVAGLIFGKEAAQRNIVGDIESTVGHPVAKAAQEMLANNADTGGNTLTTIIGLALLLVGAAGVFSQLQEALNVVWKVTPKPSVSVWSLVRDRFVSLTMVLGTGFLLLVSLMISHGPRRREHTVEHGVARRRGSLGRGQHGRFVRGGDRTVRSHLQVPVPDAPSWKDVAVGAHSDVGAVAAGQIPAWLVPGPSEHDVGVRRRGVARGDLALGLLRIAGAAVRRGVHPGLRPEARRGSCSIANRRQHGADWRRFGKAS